VLAVYSKIQPKSGARICGPKYRITPEQSDTLRLVQNCARRSPISKASDRPDLLQTAGWVKWRGDGTEVPSQESGRDDIAS
jgi:hypothetical protein